MDIMAKKAPRSKKQPETLVGGAASPVAVSSNPPAVVPPVPVPSVPPPVVVEPEVLEPPSILEPPPVGDADLDELFERVVALHDGFKRQEVVYRVLLGRELLRVLYGGRFDAYSDRRRSKPESLSRFYARHRGALDMRGLGEEGLRKCLRVAEFVSDPAQFPDHITFSHLLELVPLPDEDRAWFLRNKVLKAELTVKELRSLVQDRLSELRARAIEDEEGGFAPERNDEGEGPPKPKGYAGNVPRRVDAVLNEVLAVSRDLAPELRKRPDVAGEALERWLKVKEAAEWWVDALGREEG
jgi:hypothetical protein